MEIFKNEVLDLAWKNFRRKKSAPPEYENFKEQHAHWLDDYCLYISLREKFGEVNWIEWPVELKEREFFQGYNFEVYLPSNYNLSED